MVSGNFFVPSIQIKMVLPHMEFIIMSSIKEMHHILKIMKLIVNKQIKFTDNILQLSIPKFLWH